MMRSMYSGVAGLRAHQTKMDVIGNNIANVNTVGFKSSNVRFEDVYYQTLQGATGSNEMAGTAGQNAMQVGLGSSVSSITTNITSQGAAQATNNPFDIMINGDAFFVVNQGGSNYFTKAGNFNVDGNGYLCNTSGALVMGWQVNNEGTAIDVNQVSSLHVMSPENLYAKPEATKEVYVTGNIDQKGFPKDGQHMNISFYDNMGNKFTAKMIATQNDTNKENYSVNITDIIDSNNKSIFVDEKEVAGSTEYSLNATSFSFGGIDYDISLNADGTVNCTPQKGNGVDLKFNASTGKFASVGTGEDVNKVNLMINSNTGANPFSAVGVNVDFSSITMFAASGKTSLETQMGDLNGKFAGKKVGNMAGVSIDASGKIYGAYDNGDTRLLGQIAVASFANPAGLEAIGGNLFAETQNSGEFDGIGKDPTTGGNSLSTGYLEMSNVDLSAEFTEMITTQRGFQANSRIITTSDSLLEELINLKR